MSRRSRWSLAGFILSGTAFLSLVAQASFLAYSTGAAAWSVRALMIALPIGAAVALVPVAARTGRGRTAAICALASTGAIGLGYLMLFTTPKEKGANIGAGILLLAAYFALLFSSLLAWLAARDEKRATK